MQIKKKIWIRKYDPSKLFIKIYRFIESKKEDEERKKSQPEEIIAKRLELRRQAYDKELFDTSSNSIMKLQRR